jgi:hypothetical protein
MSQFSENYTNVLYVRCKGLQKSKVAIIQFEFYAEGALPELGPPYGTI